MTEPRTARTKRPGNRTASRGKAGSSRATAVPPPLTGPSPAATSAHLEARPGHRPPAPADLDDAGPGRALWQRVLHDFELGDAAALVTLAEACHALDLLEAARAELRRDGPTFRDRWGQPRPHPAAQIARDSRAGLLACLRALGLSSAGLVPDTGEGR